MPVRALPSAKSRLAADLPPALHAELVEAIRADTLAAVRTAALVARVVVVGDAAGAGVTLVQTSPGLNGALRDAAGHSARWPHDGVAALVGDLPALRADELDDALTAAAGHPSGFVADACGTGTTLLTARPGARLDPRFGTGSAARHALIAVALPGGAGLRADVDTLGDLAVAADVGLGARTRDLFGADRTPVRSLSTYLRSP